MEVSYIISPDQLEEHPRMRLLLSPLGWGGGQFHNALHSHKPSISIVKHWAEGMTVYLSIHSHPVLSHCASILIIRTATVALTSLLWRKCQPRCFFSLITSYKESSRNFKEIRNNKRMSICLARWINLLTRNHNCLYYLVRCLQYKSSFASLM